MENRQLQREIYLFSTIDCLSLLCNLTNSCFTFITWALQTKNNKDTFRNATSLQSSTKLVEKKLATQILLVMCFFHHITWSFFCCLNLKGKFQINFNFKIVIQNYKEPLSSRQLILDNLLINTFFSMIFLVYTRTIVPCSNCIQLLQIVTIVTIYTVVL